VNDYWTWENPGQTNSPFQKSLRGAKIKAGAKPRWLIETIWEEAGKHLRSQKHKGRGSGKETLRVLSTHKMTVVWGKTRGHFAGMYVSGGPTEQKETAHSLPAPGWTAKGKVATKKRAKGVTENLTGKEPKRNSKGHH